jgi:hypothetical protein
VISSQWSVVGSQWSVVVKWSVVSDRWSWSLVTLVGLLRQLDLLTTDH